MTPPVVIAAIALEPFLQIWVGEDIASSAAPVGEILLMGMWVNSMAVIPFAFLQAQGRPDLPAKFHLLELVPYIGALILGLHLAGIQGAGVGLGPVVWQWTPYFSSRPLGRFQRLHRRLSGVTLRPVAF